MNHDRLKDAIRAAREQRKYPWKGHDRVTEMVSLPLTTVNTLIKAATKELTRS